MGDVVGPLAEQGGTGQGDRRGMTILVTSGKGGTGKTTVAVNLGVAFAHLGKRAVLVEACVGSRQADTMMGLENRVVHDLVDVTGGLVSVQQALVKDRRLDRLYLLAGAQTQTQAEIDPAAFHALLRELRQQFDLVLIDGPAEFARGHEQTIKAVDKIVLVTNPEMPSIRGCDGLLYHVEKLRRDTLLLVNRYDPDLVRKGALLDLEGVAEILSQPLVGVIPKDDYEFLTGLSHGEPPTYHVHSPVTVAFEQVARRLLGQWVPITPPEYTRAAASKTEAAAPFGQHERTSVLLAELKQEVDRRIADLEGQVQASASQETQLQEAERTLGAIQEALYQLDTRRAVELLAAYGLKAPAVPGSPPAA